MTIKSFWTSIFPKNKIFKEQIEEGEKCPHSLADFSEGSRLGIDISVLLHASVSGIESAREFVLEPKVPIESALSYIKRKHKFFLDFKLIPVYVFDGANHPMKKLTNLERSERTSCARQNFEELKLQPNLESHRAEADILFKKMVFPRKDLIKDAVNFLKENGGIVIGSPFEAEWQLVSLQKDGFIDGIYTTDGDIYPLGGNKVVSDLDFKTGKCFIINSNDVIKKGASGKLRDYEDSLPVLSAFLGNDYIPRVHKIGKSRCVNYNHALDMALGYISSTNKESYMEGISKTHAWPENVEVSAENFHDRIKKTINLIKFAPVFEVIKRNSVGLDIEKPETYDIKLSSLRNLTNEIHQWGTDIGFGGTPDYFLNQIQRHQYKEAFQMKISAKHGKFSDLPSQQLSFPPHYQLAYGSLLDFGNIPPELTPQKSLSFWLSVRNQAVPTMSVNWAIARVKKILQQEKNDKFSAPKPKQISEVFSSKSYQSFESLMSEAISWCKEGGLIRRSIDQLKVLDNREINRICGIHNGITTRAINRVTGGHYDTETLEVASAKLIGCKTPVTLFKIKCTPSYKTQDYTVILAFRKTDGVHQPQASRCECPAGLGLKGCSHRKGKLLVLGLMQQHKEWSVVDLKRVLPPPIKSFQAKPISWRLAFETNDAERKIKEVYLKAKKSEKGRNGQTFRCESESEDNNDIGEDCETDIEHSISFEDKIKKIPIDNFLEIEKMVLEADSRAQKEELGKFAHKFDQDIIDKDNHSLLNGDGGPNESFSEKKEQLLFFERLHSIYKNGIKKKI